MTTITKVQHYAQIKHTCEDLLERMRKKHVDECNRVEVAKEVKKSHKVATASRLGNNVDVSV